MHKDIVNEVPIFGLWMYPGCFQTVFLLEDGVADDSHTHTHTHMLKEVQVFQKISPFILLLTIFRVVKILTYKTILRYRSSVI